MTFLSHTFRAPAGDTNPTQLSAVFQPYGAISAGLPASVLTVANTSGFGQNLAQTYFKQLAIYPDGTVLYAFQCDLIPNGFLGTVLFYYGTTLIADLDTSPTPSTSQPAIQGQTEIVQVSQG